MKTQVLTLICLLGFLAPVQAQQDSTLLTLDRIFKGSDFDPQFASGIRWTSEGENYTRLERADSGGQNLVRINAATGVSTVLVPASRFTPAGAAKPLRIENYAWSPDGNWLLIFTNSARVWRANTRGDFWVLPVAEGAIRQLGGDAPVSTLMFAKFSPDSRKVGYVRQNNLYVEDLASGAITQLTSDGSRTTINGTFDWVYEEEFGDRDGFRWSPDSRLIAYWQLDATGVRDFLLINDTDSLYSFVTPVQYPKAGSTNSSARIGVVSADGGSTRWFEVPGDPRNNYIARMDWAGNSSAIAIQHINRLQNTDEVMLGDPATGAMRTVLTERDSAWVDVVDDMRWLKGGEQFTWVSEQSGWRQVYVVPREGGPMQLVTTGNFDVESVLQIDERSGWVYYIASPENATQRYLYRSKLNGKGQPERLTPAALPGWHQYSLSPGARFAVHTWSSFEVPPTTEIVRMPGHQTVRVLVDNAELKARVAQLRRGTVRFFRVNAGPGVDLDGYAMFPPDMDSTRQYPILFNVYGEPAGVTVTDSWGYSEYLWHLMLTQQGYIVASLDNRGTPQPRGRAWRKVVYRKIGVIASEDQAGAARVIGRWPMVDSTRIGVWGWSGGGSMTLNLMFRYPGVYSTGMSVAPVPDMRLYDTIYQERYMGLPQDNAEDYRQGSPLTFADSLRGNLLVVHGSGDDNVHYQGTERLVNALVAANRPFTMMVYPNRTHGIFEGEGTTLHLYNLLTRFLKTNLPAGPAVHAAGTN
ncbi:MAG TPA: S9 family peptidase [Gemmatimonadales bacterium]|jgi:dipeptidyl-peptidase-4|nr:S9 family peptidase [Gemmatimonadales bacterium]